MHGAEGIRVRAGKRPTGSGGKRESRVRAHEGKQTCRVRTVFGRQQISEIRGPPIVACCSPVRNRRPPLLSPYRCRRPSPSLGSSLLCSVTVTVMCSGLNASVHRRSSPSLRPLPVHRRGVRTPHHRLCSGLRLCNQLVPTRCVRTLAVRCAAQV